MKYEGNTRIILRIVSSFPFLWINNVQCLKKDFLGKSIVELFFDIVGEPSDSLPWSEITLLPPNFVSLPYQSELDLAQRIRQEDNYLGLQWGRLNLWNNMPGSFFS